MIKLQTYKICWVKSTGASYSPTPSCHPRYDQNNDSNNNDNNSNDYNDHNDCSNNSVSGSASGELSFHGFRPFKITGVMTENKHAHEERLYTTESYPLQPYGVNFKFAIVKYDGTQSVDYRPPTEEAVLEFSWELQVQTLYDIYKRWGVAAACGQTNRQTARVGP